MTLWEDPPAYRAAEAARALAAALGDGRCQPLIQTDAGGLSATDPPRAGGRGAVQAFEAARLALLTAKETAPLAHLRAHPDEAREEDEPGRPQRVVAVAGRVYTFRA